MQDSALERFQAVPVEPLALLNNLVGGSRSESVCNCFYFLIVSSVARKQAISWFDGVEGFFSHSYW